MLTKKEIRIHLKLSASTFQRALKKIFNEDEYSLIRKKRILNHTETTTIYNYFGLGN